MFFFNPRQFDFSYLQNHFYLQQVPLKSKKNSPLILYLAHKSTISPLFKCQQARSQDLQEINKFLLETLAEQTVLSDVTLALTSSLEESNKFCLVLKNYEEVVGVAVVW